MSASAAVLAGHRLARWLGTPAPWIVGVLNVTPDSFADGGRFLAPERARHRAEEMIQEGATVVEVGGESTAPGSRPLDADTEWRRIAPVLEALAGRLPLAVDTYHAATAARALALGVGMINDVSALRADPAMAEVVAASEAVLVLMHAKDAPLPHVSARPRQYRDLVNEVADFLLERAQAAVRAGIGAERIVLDPGWGRFLSLDPEPSWELLRAFASLAARLHPFPVMVAVSRKGFLPAPLEERDPLSQLAALHALEHGAALVRTHHVRMMRQFLEVWRKLGRLPPAPDSVRT